ncbi:hypothetical protein [Candidatus Nitrosocosmicus sp. SS]|jgi:hypothetical protein|uniref:hypothetical protein n=1 Tax=Candidatus Nitrosocosmicus agrestis TaxID=2563600 RepID=UPI00122E7E57|nr:hypothetical protein [Candidatus Nitrosocosmicus sp. SS]KAA2281548.1 hypothetical protein F1Z66_07810 [Candidatus Nitrosocosmicus sp. SS]KAF0869751.1 hypothetical protein E5N71_03085 [Candidatus Nitrosocosmicus sp. SS]
MIKSLKSIDKFAKDSNLYRCFCGPPNARAAKLLDKLEWYDGTIEPYLYSNDNHPIKQKNTSPTQNENHVVNYCNKMMENIAKNADSKSVCCVDFIINYIGNNSLTHALSIEKAYDHDRISGFMYCTYKTDVLLESDTHDLIELFETHDQIFILNRDAVYKLHVTKENIHKLFLN